MNASPHTLRLSAHAKLNLALSVGPPAPPEGSRGGYHPIASWFVAIGLFDTVELARLPDGTPSRYEIRWAGPRDPGPPALRPTPIDWPTEKDLGVRAHRMLEQRAGRELPLRLTLIKRTPVGGGLGGGSSDAAAVLVGVDRLFGLGIARAELARLSMSLGSDIAFFLDDPKGEGNLRPASTDDPPLTTAPRPALVTGLGESITRVDAPMSTDVLLLLPPFGCPTGPVYRAFDAAATAGVDVARVERLIDAARLATRVEPGDLFNDLAEAACVVQPPLREILGRLEALSPHRVHVTGSGSTMFIIPEPTRPVLLAELAAKAESLVPELVVVPTTTL